MKETTVDPATSDAIEWKCQRAMVVFFRCLDERDYAGLLGLMHPEGVWLRQGKQLEGEQQIMEAMNARSKTLRIHHVLTNVLVDVDSNCERATLFGYLLDYRHDDGKQHTGPAPLKGPRAISTCNAELRPVAGAWRISRLQNIATFEVVA